MGGRMGTIWIPPSLQGRARGSGVHTGVQQRSEQRDETSGETNTAVDGKGEKGPAERRMSKTTTFQETRDTVFRGQYHQGSLRNATLGKQTHFLSQDTSRSPAVTSRQEHQVSVGG